MSPSRLTRNLQTSRSRASKCCATQTPICRATSPTPCSRCAARTHAWSFLCDPQRVPIPPNTQFVIAKLVLEFRAEMHWPGTVEVGTRVERVGRSSTTLAQALFVRERCVAVAESAVALMNTTSRRPAHLPVETAEALQSLGPPPRRKVPTPYQRISAVIEKCLLVRTHCEHRASAASRRLSSILEPPPYPYCQKMILSCSVA